MTDFTELERLLAAATKGPWEVSHAGEGSRSGGFRITEYYVRLPGADFALAADVVGADMKPSEANAALIVAAVNALPRLLEIARAAKYVAYSNGFDAALPDKIAALRSALSPLEQKEKTK